MKPLPPHQDELPLRSVRPSELFPGRTTLYVSEVSCVLRCSVQHVINLIEEFESTGGASGIKGFSIGRVMAGARTPRAWWRIAVSDLETFLKSRATSHTDAPSK